ncbi:glycosyltransferase [Pseudooceanicola sp. CBS1P-1]|uniref:Glycosyltransferase n=1 Tax=Pseudooceanicola albus TaxID=2692189 RepID=A0A6L7G9Q9_9RHOB|nr:MULTISPECIES: glycosyltransferase [Pseudooceanicola]MBT9386716.1 glycosyltransferase [Pseudooceanicola endophyticus]MXN20801.1 glycosyltransferase [Pseudooceanicola albus]
MSISAPEATPKKLRIAFFIPWITKGRGGTENVGQMMANAMAQRGHDVHIFTFDNQNRPSVWPLDPAIRLHCLEEAEDQQANDRISVAVCQSNPDLIVGLHMNRTLLRYVRIARRMAVPIVLSEHIDPYFPQRIGMSSPLERLTAFQGAAKVHLLTESFRQTVPDYLQEKISVIPNTVIPAQRRADPAGPGKTILTVARLTARKNLSRLIEEFAIAARDHADWTLRIVGGGEQLEALRAKAAPLGLADRIAFEGHTDTPYRYLEQAQIFVLPSLFEGFPMSSLEAMTHGLPVVGYKACNGLNIQVRDGVNGFLVADSSRKGGLAGALSRLMGDSELRSRMGQASFEMFNELYSNQVISDQWEQLFLDAAAIPATVTQPGIEEVLAVQDAALPAALRTL